MQLVPRRSGIELPPVIPDAASILTQMLKDGSVATAKIEDLSVTTAKINTLAVTDAKISTCSIGKLTAGDLSVVGTIVSGGKFVTGVSPNPRIEISPTAITGYSDATTAQFYLSATDGKAYCGAGAITFSSSGLTLDSAISTTHFKLVRDSIVGYLYIDATLGVTLYTDDTPLYLVGHDYVILTGQYPTVTGVVRPLNAAGDNLGDATYYWNDVSYKSLSDRGCPLPIINSPLNAIKNIKTIKQKITLKDAIDKGMGDRAIKRIKDNPNYEFEEFDLDSFPSELLNIPSPQEFEKAGKEYIERLQRDKNTPKPQPKIGIVLNELVYTQLKAFQELAERVDKLEEKVG